MIPEIGIDDGMIETDDLMRGTDEATSGGTTIVEKVSGPMITEMTIDLGEDQIGTIGTEMVETGREIRRLMSDPGVRRGETQDLLLDLPSLPMAIGRLRGILHQDVMPE